MVSQEDENYIRAALTDEADRLAYFYGQEYKNFMRNILGRVSMLSRGLSSGMLTWGDTWDLFLGNIKSILFGPWIWGTLLIILHWMMLTNWVTPLIGGSQLYLYMMPLLLGFITFFMNFQTSTDPMDWATHFISGTMIGFTTILFLTAIWTPADMATFNFFSSSEGHWYNSWFFFFTIWGFLAMFIGVFQFYRSGGFIVAFQLCAMIMIFSYLALGPYNGYYNIVLGEVKQPLTMGLRTVSGTFSNVWMLATNPTKWVEEMSRDNVVPEVPVSIPMALEIVSISARPDPVPACEQFTVDFITKNEGDTTVGDITIGASCSKYCNAGDLGDALKGIVCGVTPGYDCRSRLVPGDGDIFTFNPVGTQVLQGREAEFHPIYFNLNVSYSHATNSSLKLTVMDKDKIQESLIKGETLFHPVTAVGKPTPAKLSLNVGPQPLKANKTSEMNARLLVSVLNGRDDGDIKLYDGDKIRIRLDSNLAVFSAIPPHEYICEPHDYVSCAYVSDNVFECTVKDDHTIKSYDVKSIFYLLCDMNIMPLGDKDVLTGLITAELPKYTFVLRKRITVQETAPLGIIDPNDMECVLTSTTTTILGGGGSSSSTTTTTTTTTTSIRGDETDEEMSDYCRAECEKEYYNSVTGNGPSGDCTLSLQRMGDGCDTFLDNEYDNAPESLRGSISYTGMSWPPGCVLSTLYYCWDDICKACAICT